MNSIVVFKSKYGATKKYAQWIAEELDCRICEAKSISIDELAGYDVIIYGGGLYAEVIDGITLITRNIDKLADKKIIAFTTGITPLDCREYYDVMVFNKNFKTDAARKIKMFNFLGKMILSELSLVHRTALKGLKKLMQSKENPTEMEKMLISLCDADGDFCDRNSIKELVEYAKE